METEERIRKLESDVQELKVEIHKTLVEISKSLPEQTARPTNWNRGAWALALVNLLMAVVLLGNSYLLAPLEQTFTLSPLLLSWIQALWLVIAFIWLLLQLYPLALLLTQEREWQRVSLQNGFKVIQGRPGMLVLLTCLVLVIALVNVFLPAAWLVVTLALLVVTTALALRTLFDLRYKTSQAQRAK